MKKASLIFASLALASAAALNPAAARAQSAKPLQVTVEDERREARVSAQTGAGVSLRFEGLRKIKEADLLRALGERGALVSKENVKDPLAVRLTARAIMEILADRGYLRASVTVRNEPAPSVANGVVFIVNEGERSLVTELVFEGNRFLTSDQLLDAVKWAEKNYSLNCMPSAEYDSEVFMSCLRFAQSRLHDLGYLQARLGTPERRENERGGLTLIVPVTEGALYRLGAIRIEGGTVFTPEQMLGMLGLRAGDVARLHLISQWLHQKLKEAYGEMGYLQYEYDIEPEFRPSSEMASGGVVNFQVTISEGQRFFVRKISFQGASPMTDDELRRLLYIHEGEPFNQRKLVESMKSLHRAGLIERADESGVDYRTSEAKGLIDLVITLKGQPARASAN